MPESVCSWCGVNVAPDDCYEAAEPIGERRASFCRLEHVVPWAIEGAYWETGAIFMPARADEPLGRCAQCDAELDDARVVLVHHRGEHRVVDPFCGVQHMLEWARGGGRWR